MIRGVFFKVITFSSIFIVGGSCFGGPSRIDTSVEVFDCSKMSHGKTITGTPGITLSVSNCSDYKFKKEKIASALMIFVKEYASTFNVNEFDVWESLRNLNIEVSAIPRTVSLAYNIKGELVENVPVTGLALNKNHIWVEIRTSHIWSSSLVHELVHIIIWRSNLAHGDPDHEGKRFSGWGKEHTDFIKKVNETLLDLDI